MYHTKSVGPRPRGKSETETIEFETKRKTKLFETETRIFDLKTGNKTWSYREQDLELETTTLLYSATYVRIWWLYDALQATISMSIIYCVLSRLQSRGLEPLTAGLQSLRLASQLKPWLRTIDLVHVSTTKNISRKKKHTVHETVSLKMLVNSTCQVCKHI